MSRPALIGFPGRVLFLTEDPALLKAQLEGEDLPWDPDRKLLDNISTDEITPGWVCFYYDQRLGRYSMVGLRGKVVSQDALAKGGFSVIVSGLSKGCGSSRETAPYSEMLAGIRLVIARSIEKIYGQNSENIGLLTSTDLGLVPRILAGEAIPLQEFTQGLDPISAAIVAEGGLFEYSKARLAGRVAAPPVSTRPRPMTLVEKIIARHAVVDVAADRLGTPAVAPGDALFVRADVRFSHEYVTPMAAELFMGAFGKAAQVTDPGSVVAFRDHLTFLGQVMPVEHRKMGLLEEANGLARTQESFCARQGIRLYGEVAEGGSEAICHNAVLEDLVLPGQVVVGTDSHTCTAGAAGAFAFGVGSTDMANGWYTADFRVRVPETVRYVLTGQVAPDCSAKDVILYVMAQDYIRQGHAIGKVLEFSGEAVERMNLDERATLTNMAVEAGAFTGIIAPDPRLLDELSRFRGLPLDAVQGTLLASDPDAAYAATFEIDLTQLKPIVATPGDPRNGVPIEELGGPIKVDIAYGGSCTGGKMTDMDMYAKVLGTARAEGRRVADGVSLYIQFGSQAIRRYAESKGYIEVFQAVGAQLVMPSCGACIKAGPGVSLNDRQVTISAINRNFPGRSGPGQVYLANPYVVAASAITGYITAPRAVARF
jgi:3-isopropylmalate/(R)-2-methylmalate dehydratase large subunit